MPLASCNILFGAVCKCSPTLISEFRHLTECLQPIGSPPNANSFFQSYLAAPITLSLFIFWKVYTRDWGFGVNLQEVDLDLGRRVEEDLDPDVGEDKKRSGWRRALSFIL